MAAAVSHRSNSGSIALGALLLPASALALIIGQGDMAVALSPLIALLIGYAVFQLPVKHTLSAIVFVAIVVDNPLEKPANGKWQSFFYPVGKLLFVNLSKHTGVNALAFCLLDLLVVLLLIIAVTRAKEPGQTLPPVKPLNQVLFVCFAALCASWVYGVFLRGGHFQSSLWQIRCLMFTPLVAYLFVLAFRHPDDLRPMGTVLVLGSCFKALIGFYYFWFICRPLHEKPQYVTSHADTMLYATSIGLLLSYWLETRSRRSILAALFAVPIIALGMITNDRRLVFVSIAGGCITMFFLLDAAIRARFVRYGLLASPLLAVYFAVGMSTSSKSLAFLPVQRVMSVVTQEDRSSGTRDIENFNLIWTLKPHVIYGQGFGHEYREVVEADSIKSLFALYRYIGHNSVLWLWSVGGYIGFSLIWLYQAVAMFLLVRSYRLARGRPLWRVVAMTSVFALIAYQLQAWGDMGIVDWSGIFLVAGACAAASRLAVAVGAWGAPPPAPAAKGARLKLVEGAT